MFNASAIQLYSTRIIYNEGQKEVLFKIKNESSSTPYLVQTWISKFKANETTKDFITIPPLINLAPESVNELRILFSSNQDLPKNHESIYRLNVLSIPAVKNTGNAKIILTTRLSLKLIYRPEGLSYEDAKEAYKKLSARKVSNLIVISNPTPYYINIKEASFNIDNLDKAQLLNISTIEPFGTVELECKSTKVQTISILAIDDYGATHKSQIILNGI